MAGPGSCNTQCYAYGCGSNHRTARPTYNYPFPDISDRPTAAFTNALRTACNTELAARRSSVRVSGSDVVTGQTLVAKTTVYVLEDLKKCINSMSPGYVTNTYSPGTFIAAHYWTDLRDKINKLMRDCLCYSDCGSNAWCGCYNDCGCYYSDFHLKTDIVYF